MRRLLPSFALLLVGCIGVAHADVPTPPPARAAPPMPPAPPASRVPLAPVPPVQLAPALPLPPTPPPRPAPLFNLPGAPRGPTQGRFRLADHVGQRPVVVLFWATWSVPCTQELQLYEALYRQYGGRLMVVGINVDGPDSTAQAGPTARQLGITFPIVTDLETQATNLYNPGAVLPYSVWIDRSGSIVHRNTVFSPAQGAAIASGVAAVLNP